MRAIARVAYFGAAIGIAAPAMAGPNWLVQPVQVGQETIRYQRGVPTIDLELADGVAQITPMAFDHGSLVFAVAVYNDSRQPANFGIEHVGVAFQGRGVRVFSRDDLVKQAKNRAAWSQFGLALLGGVAAGAAASQQNYYHSTLITPRGTYLGSFSAPSLAGQMQANAIIHDTAWGIGAIQYQLDRTVEMLGNQVIQTTTVYPGESYAGQIVLAKVSPKQWPAQLQVTLNWNGAAYPFTFQIAKPGTPAPLFNAITRQSDLIDFRRERAKAEAAKQAAPTFTPEPEVIAQAQPAPHTEPVTKNKVVGPGFRCITCR